MFLLLDMLPSTNIPVVKRRGFIALLQKMTWSHGKSLCNKLGGHLVSISSNAEAYAINEWIIGRYGEKGSCWIGINDIDNDGIYSWSDGSKLAYENWVFKGPGGQCGFAFWSKSVSGWFTASCDEKMMCICSLWH